MALFREKCKEAFRNQLEEYNLKRQKRCALCPVGGAKLQVTGHRSHVTGHCFTGDSIRWNDGTVERWNGMAEHTEYSKTRNIRNILKHGIYDQSKTRNTRISLKRGMRGKYLKKDIKNTLFE